MFYVDNVTVTELSNNFTAGLQPDVVEYYDYDPFGMQIAKRSTQLGKYRYGLLLLQDLTKDARKNLNQLIQDVRENVEGPKQ